MPEQKWRPFRERDPRTNIPPHYTKGWEAIFHRPAPNIRQLPPDDPRRQEGEQTERAVTALVEAFRHGRLVSHPIVVSVMQLFYDLVHHNVIPCATMEKVATPHFLVVGNHPPSGEEQQLLASFVFPVSWWRELLLHPRHEQAALVYIASQGRDFWSGKIPGEDPDVSRQRARALEAEFLLAVGAAGSPELGNGYAAESLVLYPKGLASLPPGLWYLHRPFVAPASSRPAA